MDTPPLMINFYYKRVEVYRMIRETTPRHMVLSTVENGVITAERSEDILTQGGESIG